jgi:hypothetical protein
MVSKDGWWRHTDEPAGKIYERPDDRNDVRIGFHHCLSRNRDLAVGEQTLKVPFRNMGANDQAFIDAFEDSFYENKPVFDDLLPPSAEVTGNKRNVIEATYDIMLTLTRTPSMRTLLRCGKRSLTWWSRTRS